MPIPIVAPIEWYQKVAKSHGVPNAALVVLWLRDATGWRWSVEHFEGGPH